MDEKNPNLSQDLHPVLSLLINKGKIGPEKAQEIHQQYQTSKESIILLINKLGLFSEEELIQIIAQHEALETIDLSAVEISKEVFDLVPQNILQKYQIIPLKKLGEELVIVMSDPNHFQAIHYLVSVKKIQIQIVLSTPSAIRTKLEALFSAPPLEVPSEKKKGTETLKRKDSSTKQILRPKSSIQSKSPVLPVSDPNDEKKMTGSSTSKLNRKTLSPAVSGSYKKISKKQSASHSRLGVVLVGLASLTLLGIAIVLYSGKEEEKTDRSDFSPDFSNPPEKNIQEVPASETNEGVEMVSENQEYISVPWISSKQFVENESRQVKTLVHQLFQKTREGEFDENKRLLLNAKNLWLACAWEGSLGEIEAIDGYLEKERWDQQKFLEKIKQREETEKREAKKRAFEKKEETLRLEDKRLLEDLQQKMITIEEKMKKEEKKKNFEEAKNYLVKAFELLDQDSAEFKSRFYDKDLDSIRKKWEQKKSEIAEALVKIKKEETVKTEDDETLQKLKLDFPNGEIKKLDKEGNYSISYSFSKKEERNDFKVVFGEFSTTELSGKGIIQLEPKFPFENEFKIIIELDYLPRNGSVEQGILWSIKHEKNYSGIFINSEKKSIALLKYSNEENAENKPLYLAQSIAIAPKKRRMVDNARNKIELKISPNKMIMKINQFEEIFFSLEDLKIENIGFYSKNSDDFLPLAIKRIEIIGKLP